MQRDSSAALAVEYESDSLGGEACSPRWLCRLRLQSARQLLASVVSVAANAAHLQSARWLLVVSVAAYGSAPPSRSHLPSAPADGTKAVLAVAARGLRRRLRLDEGPLHRAAPRC